LAEKLRLPSLCLDPDYPEGFVSSLKLSRLYLKLGDFFLPVIWDSVIENCVTAWTFEHYFVLQSVQITYGKQRASYIICTIFLSAGVRQPTPEAL
jgi:hypothetical protein